MKLRRDPHSTTRMPRSLLVITGVLLAARIALALVPRHVEPDIVAWRELAGSEEAALAVGKPALYDVSAAWCMPCRRLDAEVFHDAEIAALINERFVPVRIVDRQREDGRNTEDVQSLLDHHRIRSFPTLLVVTRPGLEPQILEGYRGREETRRFLEKAAAPPP